MGQFECGKAFVNSCNKLQSSSQVETKKAIAFNKARFGIPLAHCRIGRAKSALRSETLLSPPLPRQPTASQATFTLASGGTLKTTKYAAGSGEREHMQRVIAVFLLSAVLFAYPARAKADGLTLNSTNLTVSEGTSITLSFTMTNNLGQSLTGRPFPIGLLFPNGAITGDTSDTIAIGPTDFGNCLVNGLSVTLSPGSSCSFSINFTTDGDAGETDADFGITPVEVSYLFRAADGTIGQANADFTVKVVDVTPAPESSSLLMLCTGLLGLMGMGLYKRRLA